MFLFPSGPLFLMRRMIIMWTYALIAPIEPVFDAIDDELENRGHHVRPTDV